jgi:hypothetical protein
MARYIPSKIETEVLCLVSKQNPRQFKFSPSPWKQLARAVHCQRVSGDHFTCLTKNLDEVARIVARYFRQIARRTIPSSGSSEGHDADHAKSKEGAHVDAGAEPAAVVAAPDEVILKFAPTLNVRSYLRS